MHQQDLITDWAMVLPGYVPGCDSVEVVSKAVYVYCVCYVTEMKCKVILLPKASSRGPRAFQMFSALRSFGKRVSYSH